MSPILIRLIDDSEFSPAVPVGRPIGVVVANSRTAHHRMLDDRQASTGFWECEPGQFRRQVVQAEYSFIVSGEGSFTPDDGETVEFKAGDVIYFKAQTEGVWNIRQTVRKSYLILD
ncbi:cupin domain-containing protein [Pseudomonas sp. NPDC089547]|uniref:cupin domain-containing protein n=1 Tax=Pseudomonas sp. NPDC089547 TaxID=3390652 RepID=UPI003D04320E